MYTFLILIVLCIGLIAVFNWFKSNRKYRSKESVSFAYDAWTNDRLLERLWGEHIHLGYYNSNFLKNDFKHAKIEFVHQLVSWSGLKNLPKGSKILDVGCGIGGSARILASEYQFDVLGISISKEQVKRANELTPEHLTCRFEVMDALDLQLEEDTFDGIWSVEAGAHMPNKQLYADQMLRVLRPGGILSVADWNKRNIKDKPMNLIEKIVMKQLLNQWSHPEFSSILSFKNNLLNSNYNNRLVETQDWTRFTLPSWIDSILEGIKSPNVFLELGPSSFVQGLREIPTILLMRWAFSMGLMQFGVFKLKD